MLVDWFTVLAQAMNFLILVWLMKRFLYKPILDAIDTREKKIAAELADAGAKVAGAKREQDQFQRQKEEFEQQRAGLMKQALNEAAAERQKLLDEARRAADALTAKRQETLCNDARNLSLAIARRTHEEVFAIARRTLADLAATNFEERFDEVFIRRLRTMDEPAKISLGAALATASEPALVRSGLALPAEQRAKIQNAINETFSADIHLRFETAPDLISGIELTTNGLKVAWSIADYLTSLEKAVAELLKPKDKPTPDATVEPAAAYKPEPKVEVKSQADAKIKHAAEEGPDTKREESKSVPART